MHKYGLTCDNLLSVDITTADGRLLKANAEENGDLLWAIKGGGGNFGIVTSFEYRLHPLDHEVWRALPMYPLEKAVEAVRFFRDFMAEAPEELGAIAIFWSVPHVPEIPKNLHGTPVIIFAACYTGPFERGESVIQPLREFDTPIVDLSSPMQFLDVQRFLDADYPDGRLYYWKSMYLSGLTDDLIYALAKYTAERSSELSSIDIWCLGGAFSRISAEETPLVHRDAPFLLGIESNWDEPSQSGENIGWTREVFNELKSFSAGGSYLNFPGFAEEGENPVKGAYGKNYTRLRSIKSKYDPDNFFQNNLNIR